MFEKRTDLAVESHEIKAKKGIDDGIELEERSIGDIKITVAEIKNGNGESLTGKQAGKYITVDIGKAWRFEKTEYGKTANIIASEIKPLLPKEEGTYLVVGLGNESITPDSLGPKAVNQLIVTRHIKSSDPFLFTSVGFGSVAAISPGVLGQTGIESAEIIKSVCESISPKCVIIIDSLASRRLSRLATTVQISDVGIKPGSGVFNSREALSEELFGVPVISIGVPTVVDAATLAHDLLEEAFGEEKEEFGKAVEKIMAGEAKGKFVAPKETDVIIRDTSKLIAMALNIALHGMDISEAEGFTL